MFCVFLFPTCFILFFRNPNYPCLILFLFRICSLLFIWEILEFSPFVLDLIFHMIFLYLLTPKWITIFFFEDISFLRKHSFFTYLLYLLQSSLQLYLFLFTSLWAQQFLENFISMLEAICQMHFSSQSSEYCVFLGFYTIFEQNKDFSVCQYTAYVNCPSPVYDSLLNLGQVDVENFWFSWKPVYHWGITYEVWSKETVNV